jgi:hypothetical protein
MSMPGRCLVDAWSMSWALIAKALILKFIFTAQGAVHDGFLTRQNPSLSSSGKLTNKIGLKLCV